MDEGFQISCLISELRLSIPRILERTSLQFDMLEDPANSTPIS